MAVPFAVPEVVRRRRRCVTAQPQTKMKHHFSFAGKPGGGHTVTLDRPRRPRSARAHDAVLTATSALMREDGITAITIDRIAARSGVSTATIYKHWPCKAAIIAEAFGRDTAEAVALPDTGRPIDDLVTYATDLLTHYTSPEGALFGQLLAACATEPQAAPAFHQFFLMPRRAAVEPFWDRAAEAGLT